MRRAAHHGFNVRAVEAYRHVQEKQAASLVLNILQDSDRWDSHLRRSAASTILQVAYGMPPLDDTPASSALIKRLNGILDRILRASIPGAYFVDIFPWMLHIPDWMARWKREGRAWCKKDTQMFIELLDKVSSRMVSTVSRL